MAAKGRSARYQTIDKHTSQNSQNRILERLVYTRFRLLFLMFFFAMKAIYVIEIFPSSLSKDLNCAHSAIRRLSQRIQKARRCIFDLVKTCDPAKDYWKFYNWDGNLVLSWKLRWKITRIKLFAIDPNGPLLHVTKLQQLLFFFRNYSKQYTPFEVVQVQELTSSFPWCIVNFCVSGTFFKQHKFGFCVSVNPSF